MRPRPWTILIAQLALIALSVLFVFPFFWMLSTSLKVDESIQSRGINLLPRAPYIQQNGAWVRVRPLLVKEGRMDVQLYDDAGANPIVRVDPSEVHQRIYFAGSNYAEALQWFPFARYLFNTLTICVISVFGTILSCSLVAYGLACVNWRGRELLFWIMLATMMLPGQVTMIPLFLTYKKLSWIDSILPLVVPTFLGNAFFIFLLRQFYRSVPVDLLEAARMDGASDLRIWASIMLPLSRPALAVVGLFTFIGAWNDFLGPLIYLLDEDKYTLSIGLAMFQGQYGTNWGQMMAMSLLMTVPIIVLFFFTQRTFIQGVKLAGVKG